MKKGITMIMGLMLFSPVAAVFGQAELQEKSAWEQLIAQRNPRRPIEFGYESKWIAVKTVDTEKLLNVLNLEKMEKANWVEGTIKGNQGYVFVLPPIEGWILISGWDIPTPYSSDGLEASKKLLNQLSKNFGEAQVFGTQRAGNAALWMKSVNGVVERLYCLAYETSNIEGKPTPVEEPWTLFDSNSPEADTDEYWESALSPDPETVLEVAASWSINPMNLIKYSGVGEYGYIGILRKK